MTELSWEQFEAGLAGELPFMQPDDTVSLRWIDHYVQLTQLSDALHVEAVSNANLPPSQHLSAEAIQEMQRRGWRPPQTEPWGYDNWWDDVACPMTTASGRDIAQRIVHALRDVFGVTSPSQLSYRAWHYTTERELKWKVFESLPRQSG